LAAISEFTAAWSPEMIAPEIDHAAAVDTEGEVLDVLVQSKRNKHPALKLMRKLLKKYGFAPDRMITDDLRSYGAPAVSSASIEGANGHR
jgi:transposase-like protein